MHARTPRAASALLAAAIALLLFAGCSQAPASSHTVAHCSWSYFGDPRAVVHSGRVYTGCIGTDGRTIVERYDLATGSRAVSTLFEPLEADDHNNRAWSSSATASTRSPPRTAATSIRGTA